MDITDILKDVNHWGMLAVCVYGIIVCVSYLFKKSVNEKIRIAMTVIAVAFLAGKKILLSKFSFQGKQQSLKKYLIPMMYMMCFKYIS